MTRLCTVQSTRQPGTWEQVFGVVVRATDFPETVVRLAMGASTRLAVEAGSGWTELPGTTLLPVTAALCYSIACSRGDFKGGETDWDTAAGRRELLTEALNTKQWTDSECGGPPVLW
jgi:hypothetical protein